MRCYHCLFVSRINISDTVTTLGLMAEKSKVSERIVEIDQCFGVSGQTLAVNGRVLIAEGVLTKSCRSGIKARQFFLFNDILVRTE